MLTIERLLADIIAARDCDSSRRLALDVWSYTQLHGEEAGVSLGLSVLDGVLTYAAASRTANGASAGSRGTVLGTKAVPRSVGYWWTGSVRTKSKIKPLMGWCEPGRPPPDGAAYWSVEPAGWWLIRA